MSDSAPQQSPEIQAAIAKLRSTRAIGSFQAIQAGDVWVFRTHMTHKGELPPKGLSPTCDRIGYFSYPDGIEPQTYEELARQCTKLGEEEPSAQ